MNETTKPTTDPTGVGQGWQRACAAGLAFAWSLAAVAVGALWLFT